MKKSDQKVQNRNEKATTATAGRSASPPATSEQPPSPVPLTGKANQKSPSDHQSPPKPVPIPGGKGHGQQEKTSPASPSKQHVVTPAATSSKPQPQPKAAPQLRNTEIPVGPIKSNQSSKLKLGSSSKQQISLPRPPPSQAQANREEEEAQGIRRSRFMFLKHTQIFPATSPQGRLLSSRKGLFRSDHDLLAKESGGFMIPTPAAHRSTVDSAKRVSPTPTERDGGGKTTQPYVTESSKARTPYRTDLSSVTGKTVPAATVSTKKPFSPPRVMYVEPSVTDLKRTPAKTQVPSNIAIADKSIYKTGIHTLDVKPVDSAIVGEKVLKQKAAILNLPLVALKLKPKALAPEHTPGPSERAPEHTAKASERSPKAPEHTTKAPSRSQSPGPKITLKRKLAKMKKSKGVLGEDELPKSDYLLGEDESLSSVKPVMRSPSSLPLYKSNLNPKKSTEMSEKSKPRRLWEKPQKMSPKPLQRPTLSSFENLKRMSSLEKSTTEVPSDHDLHHDDSMSTIPHAGPRLTAKFRNMLAKKVERRREHREKHLRHLHAKYNWRRIYTLVKSSLHRQKQEAEEEQKRIEAEEQEKKKLRKLKKKKKKSKKGWFVKLIEYFDEDEGEDISEESLNEEEEILRRTSFQQLTLGERRAEIRGVTAGHTAIDMPVHVVAPKGNRKGSDVIRSQQIGAASRRVRNGGNLEMDIPTAEHPLNVENIQKAPSYEEFTKGVRNSLPSTYALPHDDAAMRLFDKLVPLLKPKSTEIELEEDRIRAAEDALDEFRVAKLHDQPARALSGIRFLPGNLEERRGVMTKLEGSRANESCRKQLKYFFKDLWMTVNVRFGEIFMLTELWHEPLHQIEMNFGVSASTYFRWLRSVLLLNCLYSIFALGFIVIPEVVTDDSFKNLTSLDFFLAEGHQSRSKFFYGMYAYHPHDHSGPALANTALRFVIVLILITLMDSVFIGLKVRQYYTRMTAKVSDSDKTGEINFFALFLSAWDYNLTSETAVKVQRRTIARDFNEMMDLYEEQLRRKEENKDDDVTLNNSSPRHNWSVLVKHWVINLAVMVCAGGFGYGVYSLLNLRGYRRLSETEEHTSILIELYSSAIIALVLNIFSPLCNWVASFETFKTTKEKIFVTVFRLGSFYISILTVLYIFWISNSLRKPRKTLDEDDCWEEDTGTEIYRLILFEGITNMFMTVTRYILIPAIKAKWMKRRFEKSLFEVEYFTLNLIFLHTLSGVGTFFFPLLPLVVIARLLVTFYWKKFVLNHFCAYAQYQLHPSEIFAPYVVAFFGSYLCVVISNSWLLSEESPSSSCGPFTGYANSTYSYVFQDVVTSNFGKFARYWVSPWFLYCAIIILGAVVYMFHAWTTAYFETMNLLHDLLRLERLDREFLLRAMYNIPGVERQKKESQKSNSQNSIERERERRTTNIGLFLQQQEVLTGIFDERPGSSELGSTHTKSTGSGSGHSGRLDMGSMSSPNYLPEYPTRHNEAARRYKHLALSAKALHLIQRNPRRLSKAANIYNDLVEKVIELEEEREREPSILDNNPAWSAEERPSEKS